MKVFVVSDLEGVSGVTKPGQTTGGAPMFEESRRLYTEEINACVRGASAAGATEIVVMDCHGAGEEWDFNSLIPELLDESCDFVVQVEYKNTRAPDALRHRQGVERVSDRMIVSRADTWWDAWRQFFF